MFPSQLSNCLSIRYVGSDTWSDTDAQLHALDAATGAVRWTFEHADGSVRSPVVTNGTVFFGTKIQPEDSTGSLYALVA